MKVAVTATGPSLDATLDPRFGRCLYFVLVETDDMSFEAIENANISLGGGAGIQSAQLMADKDVKAVLTGNCGPNAHQTLSAAGIDIIAGCSGTVSDVVEQFKSGKLYTANAPTVASHSGMASMGQGMGGGGGQGMGGGGGRGMRGGGGQGMGGGGGRGMGGGGGQGMGGGGGRGMGGAMGAGPTPAGPAPASVDDIAVIDPQKCTGCALCIDKCPNDAISLSKLSPIPQISTP